MEANIVNLRTHASVSTSDQEQGMKAKIVNLETLFGQQVSYRIPQFQRPYAWGQEYQWEPLWNDVRKVAGRCLDRKTDDGKIRPHFMGAIVLQPQTNNTGEVTKRIVVDGQQRLTTLQLLIKAAEQVFQSQDDTVRASRLRELITNPESYWGRDHKDATKIRQSNYNDQIAFQYAIRDDYIEDQRRSAISEAYKYFKAEVNKWLNSEPENRTARADALEDTLTEHLQIAAIDLHKDEKPHIIFETLNARGEPLKQSDLIKNTVMYEANVIDDAQKARELWGMFDDEWWRRNTGESRLDRIHIDRFLNYWMVMQKLEDVSANKVAWEFQNDIEKRNNPIETVVADIRRAGGIYEDLEKRRIPEIECFLKRMKVMELGVVTPLLLWLYTSKVSQEQRLRSVKALESYLVRQMLFGFKSQGLTNFFISLLKKLDDDSPDHADDIIIDYLSSGAVYRRVWPSDRQLRDSLTTEPMQGTVTRRKMILEAIEMTLRSDKSESFGATDKLTVEHIMPQKWEKNWPLPSDKDETEATDERNKAVKSIGNLTLTTAKLNATLSNNSWSKKRKTLGEHSTLFLNKTLLDGAPDVWDEASIKQRSCDLAERIMQIWPSAEKFTPTSV
jgi:uncharacterized protein with ParB-like and HNH nuclease domain